MVWCSGSLIVVFEHYLSCRVPRFILSSCPLSPCFFSLPQIGAYDQQIWEKSVEQREIKVRLIRRSAVAKFLCVRFIFPRSVFLFCCVSPPISFRLELFCLSPRCPVCFFFFFLFNSLLFALVARLPPLSVSIPSSPSVFSLLSAVYLSGEYTAGDGDGWRVSRLPSPSRHSRTSAHPAPFRPPLLDL